MADGILGKRVSVLLKAHGLSQKELAGRIGVTECSMSRYMNGERVPKWPIVVDIADALYTSVEDLIGPGTGSDPVSGYQLTQRAIARYAESWTQEQKADLVDALSGSGD